MTWDLGNKAEEGPEEESLGQNSPQCREKRKGASCDLGVTDCKERKSDFRFRVWS